MTLIYNEIAAKESGVEVSPIRDLKKRGMTVRDYDPVRSDGKLTIFVNNVVGILPDYIEISKYCP